MDTSLHPSMVPLLLKTAANYLSDLDRLKIKNLNQLKRIRDKNFIKLVNYAKKVPLYQDKFKENRINPKKIKGFEDIEKFPIINREDIVRKNNMDLIRPGYEKNAILSRTSGSTRTPVSIYQDRFTLLKSLILYSRELKYYGLKWNKSRFSLIANFYSDTAPTQYFSSGANPAFKPLSFAFSTDNIQQINCDDDLKSITNRINDFQPECIMGFPGPIRHMALLKEKGLGEKIKPRCIISTGAILDKYEKKNIEEIFDTKVYDIFNSNEGGPISFECKNGNHHIHSDVVYLEVIDKKGNVKDIGKEGILSITRTYGQGTPLIRYTGMGDIISLKDETCDCGLNSELMELVHGRIKECIVLPNGKIIYPRTLMEVVGYVLRKFKTNKLYMNQFIQRSLEKIEVRVIIDEELRDQDPPTDIFLKELEKEYRRIFGEDVELEVKEVKELLSEDDRPDSKPGIISKIDVKKYI